MKDKAQEILKALEAATPVLGHANLIKHSKEWLSYLLTELDAAKQDKDEIQADIAVLKFAHKEEVRHLQRELDTAKQENVEFRIYLESLVDENNHLQQQLKQAQQENERLKGERDNALSLRNVSVKHFNNTESRLKQAIHPIKEAHRLLELHRTAEAHATLTAAVNTVVEQVEKENTHEK